MSRSKARRCHKRLSRINLLKETNPTAFTQKGVRVFEEAVKEAAYRLKLLVEGDDNQTPGRIGWKPFEDLLGRVEIYGLRDNLQNAIAELVDRHLCRPLAGRPVERRRSPVIRN